MDGIFEFGKLRKRLEKIYENISSKIWNPTGVTFSNQLECINNLDYVVESRVVGPFHYELTLLPPAGSPFEGYLIPFEIKTSDSAFFPYIRFLCPIYRE